MARPKRALPISSLELACVRAHRSNAVVCQHHASCVCLAPLSRFSLSQETAQLCPAPHLATWLCKSIETAEACLCCQHGRALVWCHNWFLFLLRIACRSLMHACKNGKRVPSCGWKRIPAKPAALTRALSRQSSIFPLTKTAARSPFSEIRGIVSDANCFEAYVASSQQI